MDFKVGYCQFRPEFLGVEKNLQKMVSMISTVEADLIVFPELATSGYLFSSKEELAKVSEQAQKGETAELFTQLAKEKRTNFVIGFSEICNGKFYNSSMLVRPDGEIFIYRKTHLFSEEKLWFEPGDTGFQVVEIAKGIKVGMMICFDWIFPESAGTLARKGAQIICHPANLVLPWCQKAMVTRSVENRVFTITANRIGEEKNASGSLEFTGQSQVTSIRGEVLIQSGTDSEEIIVTKINPFEADDKDINKYNNLRNDRRDKFYF
ncbi:MAG: beta-ureidopropionase [Candidatus Cloacimonetes bacterium]|nr:beta-ureidopropionase [Candidatus Cloacimonadota bacterium]